MILWLDHLGRSVLSRVGGHILGIVVAVLFLDWHLVEYCWILGVPVQRIAALVVVHAGSFYGLGSSVVNDKRRSIYNMIEPHRTADACRVSAVQREYFLDTSASNGEESTRAESAVQSSRVYSKINVVGLSFPRQCVVIQRSRIIIGLTGSGNCLSSRSSGCTTVLPRFQPFMSRFVVGRTMTNGRNAE